MPLPHGAFKDLFSGSLSGAVLMEIKATTSSVPMTGIKFLHMCQLKKTAIPQFAPEKIVVSTFELVTARHL